MMILTSFLLRFPSILPIRKHFLHRKVNYQPPPFVLHYHSLIIFFRHERLLLIRISQHLNLSNHRMPPNRRHHSFYNERHCSTIIQAEFIGLGKVRIDFNNVDAFLFVLIWSEIFFSMSLNSIDPFSSFSWCYQRLRINPSC